MKAFLHAETYINLVQKVPSTKLRLSDIDVEIYSAFREEFKDLNLKDINEVTDFKSEEAKIKWRNFISQ